MAISGTGSGFGQDDQQEPWYGDGQANPPQDGFGGGQDQFSGSQFGNAPVDGNQGWNDQSWTPEPPFQPEPYVPEGGPSAYSGDGEGQAYVEGNGYPEDDASAAGGQGGAGFDAAAGFEEPGQLDLGDDDVRLPWLEGEDEDYEDAGGGMGQTMLLLVLALVAIGLLVGGIFFVMRNKDDAPLVADGGVIEAPKEPYKAKPENPGGDVVAGTGDTSFAVAEGQSRLPRIGEGEIGTAGTDEAPKPGFDAVEKPAAKPSAAPTQAAPAAAGIGVQVGAYSSKEAAEAGWLALKSQYEPLSGVSHRVLQGQADIGIVYRLQAVPGDLGAARSLCAGMKSAGLSCQVKN